MPLISAIIPVYKDPSRALATVRALRMCDTNTHALEILVVDDGSGDGTAGRLTVELEGIARVIVHPFNRGRVEARNTGMREAKGDLLLFLDADCVPAHPGFLVAHTAVAAEGRCSSGDVRTTGNGFWALYQQRAAARRRRAAGVATFTSANVMIARNDILAVEGFDPAYIGYGFEDRDLALRLAVRGVQVTYNGDAAVIHDDTLDLVGVCAKMTDAGGVNSRIFSHRHANAYVSLGYARLDARLRPWLRVAHAGSEPLRHILLRHGERLLQNHRLPFSLRALAATLMAGLSFLHGSVEDAATASNTSR